VQKRGHRKTKKVTKSGIRYIKVQRYKCIKCNLSFTAHKKGHKQTSFSPSYKEEIAKRHIEDRTGYRDIDRRDENISRNTACQIVNKFALNVKPAWLMTKKLKPKSSGKLCTDGKFVYIKCEKEGVERFTKKGKRNPAYYQCCYYHGIDYETRDMPHYDLYESESQQAMDQYYEDLRRSGYDLQVLIRDGRDEAQVGAENAYGKPIIGQLCHKHFMDTICEEYLKIQGVIKYRQYLLDRLRSNKKDHTVWDSVINRKVIKTSKQIKAQLRNIRQRYYFELEIYDFLRRLFAAGDYDKLVTVIVPKFYKCLNRYGKVRCYSKITDRIEKKFFKEFDYLFSYLKYPKLEIPRYNNLSENYNQQLDLRLKSIRGFESFETGRGELILLTTRRRFMKYTDCSGPYKHLNGYAPLELSGVDVSSIDWLKFSQKTTRVL